ncbi:MAG: protease modulator HflK [Planctomycetota bacterium]|nr:protease modulator HflK [Planctomycetota bacterium]
MKLDRRIGWGASLAAFAVLGWLCTATVENGSRGVVERFGAAKRELAPGIHLRLPWPIESIRRAEVDRSLQMPIGYRLVDALMEIDPTPREKQWLTADTNIVELKATVLYRIFDVRAWLYGVSGVSATGAGSFESSRFALRRLGEAALTDIVAELSIDQVLTAGLAVVPSEARARIQRDADRMGLGVLIDEVQLLESKPPVGVRRAFTDVQDALADKERSIKQAEFAANRLEVATRTRVSQMRQEARSSAEAETAEARGRASAFRDLASAVGGADSAAARKLYMDSIQRILKGAELRTLSGSPEEPAKVFLDG